MISKVIVKQVISHLVDLNSLNLDYNISPFIIKFTQADVIKLY